jgi:ABC-2 type transport system permease protein
MDIITDSLLIFRREMTLSLRNPAWVIIGLTQPILYLAFFGPLLTNMSHVPGFPPGNPWQVYVPGLLVQLGLFGSAFVGFGIIADLRAGVIERMRVTPVRRLSLLLGRVLRDVVVLTVQSLVLMVAATAFGLRTGIISAVLALIIVALLAISLASLSYAGGLITKDEDAFAPLTNMLSVPVMLLSGILLPMSMAPLWLQWVCRFNPMLYVVEAMRQVFRGQYNNATVYEGITAAIVMAIISLAIGTRTFRRENA